MTWTPTIYRDIWADEDLHLIVGGRDVTYFRDVPVQLGSYQRMEPFTYGTASFGFPQITEFELRRVNSGDLAWLNDQTPVRLVKVHNGQRQAVVWRGFITRRELSDRRVVIHCDGDVAGRLALQEVQPEFKLRLKDGGLLVYEIFKSRDLPFTPRFGPVTGITLDNQGGDSDALSYLTENLSLLQTLSGQQWTVGVVDDTRRRYTMRLKDRTTVHATVFLGAEGVDLAVSDDLSEKPNRVYGFGEVDGEKWDNRAFPLLERAPAPDFPTNPFGALELGMTNADTATGDGITVLHDRLIATGDVSRRDIGGGVFSEATEDAVRSVQDQAGLPETGKVDLTTWHAIFDVTVTGRSFRDAYIQPLAQAGYVREWNRTASGALVTRNENWEPDAVPVDLTVEYPPGVRKQRARRHSRRIVQESRDKNWTGTLTLGSDAFAGGVAYGADSPTPLSRLDLREGMNIMVRGFDGGTLFHIAAADYDSDKTVRLLVDCKARDAMTLAEIRERNRENRRNTDRRHRNPFKRHRKRSWGEGSGEVDGPRPLDANSWNVVAVPAGGEGRIRKLHVELDAACEFAVMVFGESVTAGMLNYQVGNPLANTGGVGPLREKTLLTLLEGKYELAYAAGTYDRPCGYWPGSKLDDKGGPSGDPLTGEFGHRAGFTYHTGDVPALWLAIWPTVACNLKPGRVLWRANPDGD